MSIIQKLKDATVPSIYSSVASLGLYYVMVDGNLTMKVPFALTELPIYGAILGSSFIGSEIGSLATEFVAPKIPLVKDFEGLEMMAVPAALSGLSTWLAMKMLISSETEFKQAFIIGAGGNLIGQNIYNMK